MSKKTIDAITVNSQLIELNISDKALSPSGFKYNDRVVSPNGLEITIMGVAINPCKCFDCFMKGRFGASILWVTKDIEDKKTVRKISGLCEASTNLRNRGFVLKSEGCKLKSEA